MSERLLRRPEVQKIVGLSRSTIYQMVADGRFPAPIKIGQRAVAWLENDIQEWVAKRIEASRGVKAV